jgi:GT2 family glycosyltransferase
MGSKFQKDITFIWPSKMSKSQTSIAKAVHANSPKVLAVVVTWNRKHLLEQCLRGILGQSRAVKGIVLIDNNSTDGTPELLTDAGFLSDPRIIYKRFSENQGPAAGFAAGFAEAMKLGFHWLWVMDDDVIPEADALQHLMQAFDENFDDPQSVGFLASLVVDPHGYPMNVPEIDFEPVPTGYPGWNQLLGQGMVKVRQATFVSILFPNTTLREFGLPKKSFYMWGEDSDYTLSISQKRACYQVGRSRAVHFRANAASPGVDKELDPVRISLLYYFYRNQLYLRRRYYRRRQFLSQVVESLKAVWFALTARPFIVNRLRVVVFGVVAGLFFDPMPQDTTGSYTSEPEKQFNNGLK